MYKHILVPTDGSDPAQAIVTQAVEIAKEIGAQITVVAVSQPFHAAIVEPMRVMDTLDAYNRQTEVIATTALGKASAAARADGVNYNTIHVRHESAHTAIIEVAQQNGCDLIVMGLNRQRGMSSMLHESEAVRVLKHCTLPMLIL